jgi:hypothetical protein
MQILTGKKTWKRRVSNSPLFRLMGAFTLMVLMSVSVQAQNITAKVYRQTGTSGNAYGKLHIPQGGKYRMAMYPKSGVQVAVFRAHVDGNSIYLGFVDPYGGTYWIDATEVEQNFLVRTSDGSNVDVVPVTDAEDAEMKSKGYKYFDARKAERNDFKFSSEIIANKVLRKSSQYAHKPIYVMANPAKYGLAFAHIDQYASKDVNLPANSLYVVGDASSSVRQLEIVFGDEVYDQTTGIDEPKISERSHFDDAIYSLQGVRVEEPVKGNLYIRNGRKYVAE